MRGALRLIGIVVIVVLVLAVVQIVRPVPTPVLAMASGTSTRISGAAPRITWPSTGEAAVAVQGVGWMGSSGGNTPIPIGSVAKLMTAYVVLKAHPLGPGQNGPTLTLTAADQQEAMTEYNQNQSVVLVQAGEKLTELQILQGLLIPSGNNMAQLLANWVSGSQSAFVAQMNQTAKSLGLKHTTYADASGLSPQTVSTASDQVKLAEILMKNPVFAQIVASPQVDLPAPAGLVYNYDKEVGKNGVIGIKTGSTLQAGGCWVFARSGSAPGGQPVTVVGAVFGVQPTTPTQSMLEIALADGVQISGQAIAAVRSVQVAKAGQTVGWIRAPWTGAAPVVATKSVQFLGWSGLHATIGVQPKPLGTEVASGATIGTATYHLGDQKALVPLRARGTIAAPGLRWKLSRL